MKKQTPLIIAFLFCIFSMNLSAYDGIKLSALPDKNHPFTLNKKVTDDFEEGVKGKIIITGGLGVNFFGTTLELRYITGNYNSSTMNHQASPMYNLGVDYGLGEQVSIGVAFGYQTTRIIFHDVFVNGDSYHDTWTRVHLAVRGDYYIVANEEVSLYTGVKAGYNMYTATTNLPASSFPNYIETLEVYPSLISLQAHFGFSYFVKGIVGFNAEVGIGYAAPYVFAGGVTVKI